MYKVAFFTLGCKVNIYETNALKNLFANEGFLVVNEDDKADVYIINTCSVTNKADAKSRKTINKAISLNKDAIICVMGCYSQTNSELVEKDGIDIILGNSNKSKSVELVKELLIKKDEKKVEILNLNEVTTYESLEATTYDHTRAFIKIQDGCENFCSYCIIPFARGKVRCKDKSLVINEIKQLVKNGYKEVVLAGIHTGRYTCGDNYKLSDLVKDIITLVPDLSRLRLSSIEINEVDDDLLEIFKNNNVLANHFHLPLQSGCDKVLKDMNRHYDKEYYLSKINKIRSIRPDVSITTDIIVGYPTESTDDFNETLEFVKKIKFSAVHVFPYSKRENTKSATLNDLDYQVKKHRVDELIKLSDILNNNYLERFKNENLDIIIETKYDDLYYVGHASNYIKVLVSGDESLIGKHKIVRIEGIYKKNAMGKITN